MEVLSLTPGSESNIVIAVSQKLQVQDYVVRRESTASLSVIDRLRRQVIKDAEEINDSLLGMEMMSAVEASDNDDATSPRTDSSASGPDATVPADAIDFYSINRLPVDVSFIEFDPETPSHEILMQFQRLNLLYACALVLLSIEPFSNPVSQLRNSFGQGEVLWNNHARSSSETFWFVYDVINFKT